MKHSIPECFPSPFLSEPHPICLIAVQDLQNHLENQTDWDYDFGLHQPKGSLRIGKMFGVLVVQNQTKEIGYLAAFSGKLANQNHHPRFVPPVYDSLAKGSFLNVGMAELAEINQQIKELELNPDLQSAQKKLKETKEMATQAIELLKIDLKKKEIQRSQERVIKKNSLSDADFSNLSIQQNRAHTRDQKELKKLNKYWKKQLEQQKSNVKIYSQTIDLLKEKRKNKSNGLQKKLFDSYQFLNDKGELKSLNDIFNNAKRVSGAGECAAPKLLQYAFQHQLKPIAMAEFWWGKSPKSAIRQHGHFYPACEEKCRPILTYMLGNN